MTWSGVDVARGLLILEVLICEFSEHVTNELAMDGFASTQTIFDDIVD